MTSTSMTFARLMFFVFSRSLRAHNSFAFNGRCTVETEFVRAGRRQRKLRVTLRLRDSNSVVCFDFPANAGSSDDDYMVDGDRAIYCGRIVPFICGARGRIGQYSEFAYLL
jgi:hypothetical protein